ncbi:hypothetical protein LWE61_07450 [Sphingobium sufflavum]|uniref:hypothetical protein n=1 Tax=Sphingobium sufflavum TaxID=1129547 RepID=UPI001F42F330|nr:hypothetical protein [Sphingobium sufflavum]MCE7796396.1 hypothetical protein [Sphingobium sufflavum]
MDLFSRTARAPRSQNLGLIIERIAAHSKRPRYAFLVLNLIAEAAGEGSRAGPYVVAEGERHAIRDWLCDKLLPLAHRDQRRREIVAKVRAELEQKGLLPQDEQGAAALLDHAVREHVRRSGRCNVSTAVSDLVRAGLVRRHYQGYRMDHPNRGAQREAVYTLTADAQGALSQRFDLAAG